MSKRSLWVLGLAILTYLAFATTKLRYPGLHYDEMLHVNAALGALDSTFIYRKYFGIPVLLMAYIGALKSYLTAPIFALWGVTVTTIRLPLIILSAGSLLVLGVAIRRWIGMWPAAAITSLLAIDPTFISLTRTDSGPVVLQFALVATTLACFERYQATLQLRYLTGMLFSLGLGIFNKINFVWILNALIASVVIVYGRDIYRRIRDCRLTVQLGHMTIVGIGLGMVFGYCALAGIRYELFRSLDPERLNWHKRLVNAGANLAGIVRGDLFYDFAYGDLLLVPSAVVFIILAVLAAGLAVIASRRFLTRNEQKASAFFILLSVLTFVQLLVTRDAKWPWHYFALYPALQIVAVLGFIGVYRFVKRMGLKKIALAVPSIGAVLFGCYIWTDVRCIQFLGQPTKNVYWSPLIYDLYAYTSGEDKFFVSIDWGTHTQLLGLSKSAAKYKDVSFSLNHDVLPLDAREEFSRKYLSEGDYRFILHSERSTLCTFARRNFFELVRDRGLEPYLEKTLTSGDGVLFEIYGLRPLPIASTANPKH